MKYHKSSCSGHGTVTIKIRQTIKFTVSNSAPITQFSKRSEVPPWHNGYYWTDIIEFGPIPIQFWFSVAQSYREVVIKSLLLSLCLLRHCLFQERLQNWAFCAEFDAIHLKGRLLFVLGYWTMIAALRLLMFGKSKGCLLFWGIEP